MAVSASYEIQQAIFDRLTGDSAFIAVAGDVLDAPRESTFPYVVLGEDLETPWDVFGRDGAECLVTLHIYSREPGFKQSKQILAEMVRALGDSPLSVDGFDLVHCWYNGSDSFREPDMKTRRIAVRFRVTTQKEA